MTVKQFEKFIKDFKKMTFYRFDFESEIICPFVVFRPGFPVAKIYSITLDLGHRFYIAFDADNKEVELYDVEKNLGEKWRCGFDTKHYNNVELAISLYEAIKRS